jgi:hypothetical protein
VIFVIISIFVIALTYEYYITALFVSAEPYGEITCKRTGTLKVKCCQLHSEKTSGGIGFDIVQYCTDCDVGPGGVRQNCSERYIEMSAEQPPGPSLPTPPIAGENIVPGDTGVLEQPPTSSPFDPTAPLQGGILEQRQTPPTFAPGDSPGVLEQLEQDSELGFFERQPLPPSDQGAAELPPATEGSQPATVEEEPQVPVCQEGLEFNEDLGFCVPTECPEGQELNEETGICVLDEQPAAAEEPEEQQQQTEEGQQQPEPEEDQPSEDTNSEDNGNN